MKKIDKILVIAGEPSGDRHAAELIKELNALLPTVNFYGIGGDYMSTQGVHLIYHIKQMAFLGLYEIIRHLPFIRKVFKQLKRWLVTNKPSAVILVDYPGFNLRFAKKAKKLGFPVIYYICPQLWAWGKKRVGKIRKYVDLPVVIFNFEKQFYADHGIESTFVGHPLVDEIKFTLSDSEFREKHQLHPDKPIIAVLPGSRLHEVRNHLPVIIQTAQEFNDKCNAQWAVGITKIISKADYQNIIGDTCGFSLIENDIHHLLKYAYVAIVASGTATLETAYIGTPMVVMYKVNPVTYGFGRLLVTIKNIALANIVAGRQVVPELIQKDLSPEKIIKELERYFNQQEYFQKVRSELSEIAKLLGTPGAAQNAAREIRNFIFQMTRN